MKVLMVNGTYGEISGSGRAVKLLSEELRKEGIEIGLFTNNTIGYLPIPKLKSLSFSIMAKLRRKNEFDVIHVHNPKFSFGIEKETGNILTIHGDFLTEFKIAYGSLVSDLANRFFRSAMKKYKAITCVSPYWAKKRGWNYIPNGIRLNEVESISASADKYVLFVGRKDRIKGYHIFEAALKGLSYPYRMLGVYEKISWEQVIALMKSAYCLVLPSIQEGMPYVILEAWASACPVIATSLPTLKSFGKGSILFLKKRTAEEIRDSINYLFNHPDVAKKLVKNGLNTVKKMDIERVAKNYIKFYEELQSKHE